MSPSTPGPTGTVVLCGSVTRAVDALNAAADWYEAFGHDVRKPVLDDTASPEKHATRWYALIDQADQVVVCIGGDRRVGDQTFREWTYANDKGVPVTVWASTPSLPVSPAPDTEALRQQVAAVLEERIGDNSDLYETVDDVLALQWIRYAAGQRHVVTMHERNNAAIAETNRQFAQENAGLRADLDRARAEIERLAGMRALYRQNWQGARDANHQALETIARLERELARASGARTIPDDAAEQVLNLVRMGFTRGGQLDAVRELIDGWRGGLTTDALADLGATPTTDPAPAPEQTNPAQDGSSGTVPQRFPVSDVQTNADPAPAAADVQWGVQWGVQRADGVLDQRDDEPDAREHLHWFDPGTARVVSRTVVYGPWTPAPAAPQGPVEPTEPMASCGVHTEAEAQTSIRHELCTPAARVDTAPPDIDGYNSDLGGWARRGREA